MNIDNLKITLRQYRNRKKYTLQEVADIINVGKSCYRAYEVGFKIPSVEELIELAILYDTSIDSLLGKEINITDQNLNENLIIENIILRTELLNISKECTLD